MAGQNGRSRLRVAFIIDTVGDYAGTENQLVEIIKRIDQQRFEVHLLCLEDSARLGELISWCRTAVFPAQKLLSPAGLWQVDRIRRYLNRHRIDVLQTYMIRANIFGVLAARFSRCGVVVASRRNLGYWYEPKLQKLFGYLNRHTTRLLANSEGARQAAIETEKVPPAKVDMIYNGVDLDTYSARAADVEALRSLQIPSSSKVVGIVANLRPVKDLPLFLRAAEIVSRSVAEAIYVLVGRGQQQQELEQLATDLGIREKVRFTGGKGRVVDYLHRFDVACLSSSSEGFSNAVLEYMAAGLPVVATDVGGNREAVEHGVTGFVIGSRSPDDFAEPIIELLKDENRRLAMGAAGLARCRELFEITSAVRRLERYLSGLVSSDGAVGPQASPKPVHTHFRVYSKSRSQTHD